MWPQFISSTDSGIPHIPCDGVVPGATLASAPKGGITSPPCYLTRSRQIFGGLRTSRRLARRAGDRIIEVNSTSFSDSTHVDLELRPLRHGCSQSQPGRRGDHYNLRFPGQIVDGQAGLQQNYFRDFDPALGRYLKSDPIGLSGGVNTYAYANSDAVASDEGTIYGRLDARGRTTQV